MESVIMAALQAAKTVHVHAAIPHAIADPVMPALVVILQHWPDEYSQADVRALLEAFPLSRIVVAQSQWCLSQRRNGMPWPAALCVPVDHAEKRIAQERLVLAGHRAALPWTAGLDEIFAFDHGHTSFSG